MSPSWADRITLTLLGNRAFLRRRAHGSRRADAETLAVQSDSGDFASLLAAVEKVVRERSNWSRGARMTAILGNTRVRYAALPWVDDFMQRAERLAYARLALGKQYGGQTDQSEIRLAEAGYGDPWLVAGIDRSLLAALDELAEACGWRLDSVQPALMTVANEFRLRLAHGAVRLLLMESGKAVIARLEDGRWRQVRTRRMASLDVDVVRDLVAQEMLLDPDEAPEATRLCLWAFDAPAGVRDGWRKLSAEVLENHDLQDLLAQRR